MDEQVPVRGAAKPPTGATKEAELEKMLRKQEEEIKQQQQQQAGVRELFILFCRLYLQNSSFYCVRQVSFESTCASLSREDSVSLS